MRRWIEAHPDIFVPLDIQTAQNQPLYHFVEKRCLICFWLHWQLLKLLKSLKDFADRELHQSKEQTFGAVLNFISKEYLAYPETIAQSSQAHGIFNTRLAVRFACP